MYIVLCIIVRTYYYILAEAARKRFRFEPIADRSIVEKLTNKNINFITTYVAF